MYCYVNILSTFVKVITSKVKLSMTKTDEIQTANEFRDLLESWPKNKIDSVKAKLADEMGIKVETLNAKLRGDRNFTKSQKYLFLLIVTNKDFDIIN